MNCSAVTQIKCVSLLRQQGAAVSQSGLPASTSIPFSENPEVEKPETREGSGTQRITQQSVLCVCE